MMEGRVQWNFLLGPQTGKRCDVGKYQAVTGREVYLQGWGGGRLLAAINPGSSLHISVPRIFLDISGLLVWPGLRKQRVCVWYHQIMKCFRGFNARANCIIGLFDIIRSGSWQILCLLGTCGSWHERERGSVSPGMNLKSGKGGAVPTYPLAGLDGRWQLRPVSWFADNIRCPVPQGCVWPLLHEGPGGYLCTESGCKIAEPLLRPALQKWKGALPVSPSCIFLRKPTGSKAGHLERRVWVKPPPCRSHTFASIIQNHQFPDGLGLTLEACQLSPCP